MNLRRIALTLLATGALGLSANSAFAQAQQQDLGEPLAEGGNVETTDTDASAEESDEGGLTFTVTDESDWEDLGIAIPAFATDQNRPTPANANWP